MQNQPSLRYRRRSPRQLDPAREPLLQAARQGTLGVLPAAVEDAKRRGTPISPSAVLATGAFDELEARAVAGLALPPLMPPTGWREARPLASGIRLQVITPPQALAIMRQQRAPLRSVDMTLTAQVFEAAALWPSERTQAGLVGEGLWGSITCHFREAAPGVLCDDLRYWRNSGREGLETCLAGGGAVQPSLPPIVTPSLTSLDRLDRIIAGLAQRFDCLKLSVYRPNGANLADVLRVCWAEGQRAQLLAGAERIAADLARLETRLEALTARTARLSQPPAGSGDAAAEERHSLLAAIGVARATYEEKCALAASYGNLMQAAPHNPPLRHLYAAELALLLRADHVKQQRLAAGLDESLALRHAHTDPLVAELLVALRRAQAPVAQMLAAAAQSPRGKVNWDILEHRAALARAEAYGGGQ